MNYNRLEGKICVVTGAKTGIGRAISSVFAAEKATLIMVNKTSAGGEEFARELGPNVYFKVCDVSNEDSVKAFMTWVEERFGRIDVLVNNAALSISNYLESTDLDCWNRTMETNARGCFLMCKYGLPLMKKSEHASIINTGSELAIVGCEGNLAYNSSKGAIVSFSRSLALELSKYKIRVNVVCPAGTDTKAFRDDLIKNGGNVDDLVRQTWMMYPLGRAYERVGRPEDIAYAMLFLAGDESTWITGSVMMVDGGFTAT